MAIDYIKSLQRELAETKEQLRQAESKLNAQGGSNSTAEGDSTGTDVKSEQPANPPSPPAASSSAPAVSSSSSSPPGASTETSAEMKSSEQQQTSPVTTNESTTAE